MKKKIVLISLLSFSVTVSAQETWTADRCMAYAVSHNMQVREKTVNLDNARQDITQAWGRLLPSLNASVGGQWNFGRSVDPETNTYNHISTFNNAYSLESSLTLFKGGSLLLEITRAKAFRRMNEADLDAAREQTALETYDAYIQMLYLRGTMTIAREKLAQTDSLLFKTSEMERLGLKSGADVAQITAQLAADRYALVTQEQLFKKALLTLSRKMNYPVADHLLPDTTILFSPVRELAELSADTPALTYQQAILFHPTMRHARYSLEEAKAAYKQTAAGFLPTLTLYGGLSTSYYKMLGNGNYPSFTSQFRNNFGQYIAVGLSIPLFNRFTALTERRKAHNAYRLAQARLEEAKTELERLIEEAYLDRDGALEESMQLEEKVKADEWAYRAIRRQYEEGIATSLDVQQNASTLLDSRIHLLKARLTYQLKSRLVDYFKGKPLYKTNH